MPILSIILLTFLISDSHQHHFPSPQPETIKELADIITKTAVADVTAVSRGLVEKSIAILDGREWKEMKFGENVFNLFYSILILISK